MFCTSMLLELATICDISQEGLSLHADVLQVGEPR